MKFSETFPESVSSILLCELIFDNNTTITLKVYFWHEVASYDESEDAIMNLSTRYPRCHDWWIYKHTKLKMADGVASATVVPANSANWKGHEQM